jgi:ligand-binding SRPBCC domain-containing protein
MSKVYVIKRVQIINTDLETVWNFFSVANNLQDITPSNMKFEVKPAQFGNRIYAGQIIEYIIRPFLNIPFYWMTEITHVEEKKFFVDEQRFGPFSLWHHQHHFAQTENGVEMTDIVHYKLPLWILGSLAHWLFVKKQVAQIFEYRSEKVKALFS